MDNGDSLNYKDKIVSRRKRFLKYASRFAKELLAERAKQKRKLFLEHIKKLSNVKDVNDIKQLEKIESPQEEEEKMLKRIEKKIQKVLDYDYDVDNELNFNREILSKLSEHEAKKMELFKRILNEKGLDVQRLEEIEGKLDSIEDLRQDIERIRTTIRTMTNRNMEEVKEAVSNEDKKIIYLKNKIN